MKKKLSLMMTALIALLLTSCGAKKEITYFKNIDDCPEVLDSIYADYAVRIKPADELLITVWSEVAEATQLYNLPQVAYAEAGDVEMTGNRKVLSYIVDPDGYISFPVVGKIKVEGMTTTQVADLLTERISNDVRDPLVRVQMANFRVNVMGEVNEPQTRDIRAVLGARRTERSWRPDNVWPPRQRAAHTRGRWQTFLPPPGLDQGRPAHVALFLLATERCGLRRTRRSAQVKCRV